MTAGRHRRRVPRAVLARFARWRAAPFGLRTKMVAFTCGMIALVVAVDLIVDASIVTTNSRQSATASMAELADGFAAAVAARIGSGSLADLAFASRALALSSEVDDVFVFDRDGAIAAREALDTHPEPSMAEPALMRAMIDHRPVALINGATITAAAPVTADDHTIIGYVVLRGSRPDQAASDTKVAVAVAGFLLLIGVAAANAFSASITRRIAALTQATGRIAAGDLARPTAVAGRDEFGRLEKGVNRMMARTSESLTAYRRRERDLTADRERAEAASVAKREFVARVSQDLRASLNSIVGFSDLLSGPRSRAMGDKTFAAYARDINRSGRHLLTLVTNIVEYIQTDVAPLPLKAELSDAEQVVRMVAEPLAALADDGGVTLTVECIATLPIIRCDPERLSKALANVLSIAIKGTRAGGSVGVTVAEEGDTVIIRVTDTGSDADVARGPRADSGAVVGLALARRIVEQHAGGFRVESYPGIGSIVTIRLASVSPDALPPELNPMRAS